MGSHLPPLGPAPPPQALAQVSVQQQPHHQVAADSQQRQPATATTTEVPYETFYVTRACEWKSNLFVPKSNDILFAQQLPAAASASASPPQAPADQLAPVAINFGDQLAPTGANQQQQQQQNQQQHQTSSNHRTMLTTGSKALILALPIAWNPSFAGYEPACSIRLIVPSNMRILAKLNTRRLTFAQQRLSQPAAGSPMANQADQLANNQFQYANNWDQSNNQAQQQPPAPTTWGSNGGGGGQLAYANQKPQLWLNVSQNQFIESEQRTIETEGNVLAFRFLLERFAQQQVPDTRFQVVLTAFQTLSENIDLNPIHGPATWLPGGGGARDQLDQSAQFICDSQRLISANLACDGFKNCQDGHDEEPATCLALRQQNQLAPPRSRPTDEPPANQRLPGPQKFPGASGSLTNGSDPDWPAVKWLDWLVGGGGGAHESRAVWPAIGSFLLGFLLVLLLLLFCTCCLKLAYLLLKRRRRHRHRRPAQGEGGATTSGGSRAASWARKLRSVGRGESKKNNDDDELAVAFKGGQQQASDGSSAVAAPAPKGRSAHEQNLENVARLKARLLPSSVGVAGGPNPKQQRQQQQQQQQQQLHSILKRPPGGPAPLARFETQAGPLGRRPVEPPPRVPSRARAAGVPAAEAPTGDRPPEPRRGALASSLTNAGGQRDSGRRLAAAAAAQQQHHHHFRPVPAARQRSARETPGAWSAAAGRQRAAQNLAAPRPQLIASQLDDLGPPADRRHQSAGASSSRATGGSGPGGVAAAGPTTSASSSSSYALTSRMVSEEKSSAITGSQRVTVYKYSSDFAKYSESYLINQQQRSAAAGRQQPAAVGGQDGKGEEEEEREKSNNEPEAPQVPRQSSLI